MARYVFSNASPDEQRRLASIEEVFDPATFRHLETIGIDDGWSCLEVGGGGGSVARWMARRVEPNGSVIATDLDTRFLDEIDAMNMHVRVHDIVTDPLDQDFDLIHARTVLGHLPERIAVIAKLVAALRRGGWLLLEDVDISGGAHLAAAQQFAIPASLQPTLRGAYQAMEAIGAQAGFDGEFGRELPRHLIEAGLVDVDAETCSRLITGGSTRSAFYELSYRHLADAYVETGLITRGDLDVLVRSCGDPNAMMMSAPVVSAWGRRTT